MRSGGLLAAKHGSVVRPSVLAVAGLGMAAGVAAVVGGARIDVGARNPPTWWGLTSMPHNVETATLLIGGIVALAVLWIVVITRIGATWAPGTAREVWITGGCWALPFALGAPLLSSDVYTYVAQGMLSARGMNPYSSTPLDLGSSLRAVVSIDPQWRGVASPYGPLATLIQSAAANLGGGSVISTVMVFRLIAIISVIVIAICAAEIAGPERRVAALAFIVLNPLVLLQLVSAAHLEAPMLAFVMAAIVAERRGHSLAAVALGCAAAAVKIPAIVVPIAAMALAIYPAVRFDRRQLARVVSPMIATFIGMWLVFGVLVGDGWGWVSGLLTPSLGHTPSAPSSITSDVLTLILGPASRADLAVAGQVAALGIGLVFVVYLVATVRQRPVALTVGLGMFAICVTSPVIYPWYLLWALLPLGAISRPPWTARLALVSAAAATVQIGGVPRVAGVAIALGLQLAWVLYGLASGILPLESIYRGRLLQSWRVRIHVPASVRG